MPAEDKKMLIINPNAGKGLGYRMAYRVESLFKKRGWDFSSTFTYGVKHAINLAKDAVKRGYKTIVAVGGDGTINEVINGIYRSKGVKLGIVSIGTGNDYIKAVNIPKEIEPAIDVIIKGKTRKVDIGQVEDTYFVNGLGIGFDAQVAEDLFKIRRLRGFSSYLYAVIKNFFFFKNPVIELSFNKELIKTKTLLVSVMIGNCLGGGFYLTPNAKIDDGLFDVLDVGDFRLIHRFLYLPRVMKGTHLNIKGVNLYRTDEVTISSDAELKVHVDGEMTDINTHHFTVKLHKKAINLIVP